MFQKNITFEEIISTQLLLRIINCFRIIQNNVPEIGKIQHILEQQKAQRKLRADKRVVELDGFEKVIVDTCKVFIPTSVSYFAGVEISNSIPLFLVILLLLLISLGSIFTSMVLLSVIASVWRWISEKGKFQFQDDYQITTKELDEIKEKYERLIEGQNFCNSSELRLKTGGINRFTSLENNANTNVDGSITNGRKKRKRNKVQMREIDQMTQ